MWYSTSHRIGVTTTIIITLFSILSVVLADYNFGFNRNAQNFTRLITLKHGTVVYGKLQGIVVKTRLRGRYVPVEQYLGIQYAAPPEGKMRFMPTQTSPTWGENVKIADNFGHVCPQDLPDPRNMEPYRREYFKRLKEQYLMNESEDCLYLNIYAPYQGIDVGQVPIVVNYDLPVDMQGRAECETYFHRNGKTGRLGKLGTAINLIDSTDATEIYQAIENQLKHTMTYRKLRRYCKNLSLN